MACQMQVTLCRTSDFNNTHRRSTKLAPHQKSRHILYAIAITPTNEYPFVNLSHQEARFIRYLALPLPAGQLKGPHEGRGALLAPPPRCQRIRILQGPGVAMRVEQRVLRPAVPSPCAWGVPWLSRKETRSLCASSPLRPDVFRPRSDSAARSSTTFIALSCSSTACALRGVAPSAGWSASSAGWSASSAG
eukprot:2518116-Pleurochrysis_carterae.AAC.4